MDTKDGKNENKRCFKMATGPTDDCDARAGNAYAEHKASVLYKKEINRAESDSQPSNFNSFSFHLSRGPTSASLDDFA